MTNLLHLIQLESILYSPIIRRTMTYPDIQGGLVPWVKKKKGGAGVALLSLCTCWALLMCGLLCSSLLDHSQNVSDILRIETGCIDSNIICKVWYQHLCSLCTLC